MSDKKQQVIDLVKAMTVLELSELVIDKKLEDAGATVELK